ncbi:pilus assembly protein CpaE [Tessaracoccus lapidicaptus]|uniref:pilus assembly protein CpaE n=1 Tax=Tessaracoccus lapidicaptus TaxID=1427523 RepID=UPI003342C111
MISVATAERLDRAGVAWHPGEGDRFVVRAADLADEVFTLANMVVEAREYPSGTLLAFNGTTEWALDSLPASKALWLPREDQLRELLGGTFRSMSRAASGEFSVVVEIPGQPPRAFIAPDAAEAYAEALLALVEATR